MTERFLALVLLLGLVGSTSACRAPEGPPTLLNSVYVDSLSLDQRTETPVILLKETNGAGRELPIWIGMPEAQSIAMAMEDVDLPRPNTHDLIKTLLDRLQGQISRVVITELRGHTYYAVIRLQLEGREIEVDSRPSDAIAVAIRTGAPLYATDEVLIPTSHDDEEVEEPPVDIEWQAKVIGAPPVDTRSH